MHISKQHFERIYYLKTKLINIGKERERHFENGILKKKIYSSKILQKRF